jgi:hypothetical protein
MYQKYILSKTIPECSNFIRNFGRFNKTLENKLKDGKKQHTKRLRLLRIQYTD